MGESEGGLPRERIVPGESPPDMYGRHVEAYKFAARFVKDRRVVDLACGIGYGSALLRELGAKRVVGVDLSREAVRRAVGEHNGDHMDFVVADGRTLPFATSSFDVCVSVGTWAHVESTRRLAAEIRRVLARSGVFVLCTVNRLVTNPGKSALANPRNPHHVREYSFEDVRRTLSGLFTIDHYFGQTFHPVASLMTWSSVPTLLARHPASPLTLLREPGRYVRSLVNHSPGSRGGATDSPGVTRFEGRLFVDTEPEYLLLVCRRREDGRR